jgi:hypothetical protein
MMLRLRPHDVSPVLSSLAVLAFLAGAPTTTTAFSILDVLALTGDGVTCPVGCPLCHCINATESNVDACTRTRSVEACASNALDECYAGLLGGGDVDVAGMCAVQCGDGGGGQQQDMQQAFQCRLCDIFACCSDCPSERASECFPPNVENGYTPTEWEPLSCDGSNASSGGGGSSSGSRRAVEFAVTGSVSLMLAASYFATTSIV